MGKLLSFDLRLGLVAGVGSGMLCRACCRTVCDCAIGCDPFDNEKVSFLVYLCKQSACLSKLPPRHGPQGEFRLTGLAPRS